MFSFLHFLHGFVRPGKRGHSYKQKLGPSSPAKNEMCAKGRGRPHSEHARAAFKGTVKPGESYSAEFRLPRRFSRTFVKGVSRYARTFRRRLTYATPQSSLFVQGRLRTETSASPVGLRQCWEPGRLVSVSSPTIPFFAKSQLNRRESGLIEALFRTIASWKVNHHPPSFSASLVVHEQEDQWRSSRRGLQRKLGITLQRDHVVRARPTRLQ